MAFYAWLIKHNFPKGYQVLCFNCNLRKHLKFLKKDRVTTKRSTKDLRYRNKLKLDVLLHYTDNKLMCSSENCPEADVDVLCIDHVNGGGSKERKRLDVGCGTEFYRWLKRNNYPKGYQVLCANCNQVKNSYM